MMFKYPQKALVFLNTKMLDEYSFVKKALMFEIVPTIIELKIVKREFLYFSDSKET